MSKSRGLKIAIAGKGGVGKTTVAAGLARYLANSGRRVVAVDADPDANLGTALGADSRRLKSLIPIARMEELVVERAGSPGGFFRLNPKVDDLPEKLALDIDGVKLLILGSVEKGGAGCICPESALLKALVRHLVIESDDVVILDMEAGIEHLGRATAAYVDAFVIVAEPGRRSMQTAATISELAAELGIERRYLVANKVRSIDEAEAIKAGLTGLALIGVVSDNDAIRQADVTGEPCIDPVFLRELEAVATNLVSEKREDTSSERALQ